MHELKTHADKELPVTENNSGIVASTSYWIDKNEQIRSIPFEKEQARKLAVDSRKPLHAVDFNQYDLPVEARIDRLDVQFINRDQRPNPIYETIFVGQLHADEQEAPEIFDQETSNELNFPHIKVMEAHKAAGIFNRRELPLPLTIAQINEINLNNIANIIILVKGKSPDAIGLDEVIDAYHNDIAKEKLTKIFAMNPDCANELAIQHEIKTIGQLIASKKIEQAQTKLDLLKPKLISLANSHNWILAEKLNLNRQFPISENAQDWEDIEKTIRYPEARMFLQLIKDNPDIKYLFSIHEDPEHGIDDAITYKQNTDKKELLLGDDGVYFYDAYFDANNDPDHDLVVRLHQNLVDKLVQNGFRILNGIDAPDDPDLGFLAKQGYINQPIIGLKGERTENSKTLEDAFVEIGRLKLLGKNEQQIQAKRAFCLEIPGRLSRERKALLLRIYQEELIVPFLNTHGIS